MTTTLVPSPVPSSGPQLLRQMRSERIKLSSTKTWWLFGIGIAGTTGLALLVNALGTHDDLTHNAPAADITRDAANIFTSGQYFGGLFVMLLAILMITNEFYHQTATSTFLATPKRTEVILGKFVVAMIAAAVAWLLTTVISVVVGLLFFSSQNVPSQLGSSSVLRAMLVNLMVYALWAVFGIGFGALIRSQIGATVTAALLYTVGSGAVEIILALLRRYVWHTDHIYQLAVLIPGVAASVAVSPVAVEINDSARILWWVGVIVMLGYGILFGVIGTTILRKRDIS